ncbi:DUF2972 domain-containing protein [Campylobacter volucris]|uniref:DUF2972 domain-containing protein n=1 Tax=Campylobacter volucris TaxID=1031542 RepID=UPI001059EA6A|nr:DUF2972 domain-containing protein [Campylobacter volucris]TDJ81182.1 DUF2972 domain-containing protein [Campylobacter volucris]
MLNPHSAVSRIKNQLAYKLGSCIIEHKANGGGYLSLIYKLYKIKKEYFKEKKLYKQTIKLFPNLIYPDIKTLNDYNDSIRVKFHLSYMLGETLIKADKNKFKGGYLTLFKDIKQTKKDYKIIKQLLSDFNIISPTIYNIIANNKEIFIKNFNKIENILKTHKDYQVIIDNIFHNFDYVLKHLDLIQEWLLSDDFYQRYKKENHPYPSLLDPKKLNDENEEINYNNIPAELAWEMNLPLPENKYKLLCIVNYASGFAALYQFLKRCDELEFHHTYNQTYNFLRDNSTIILFFAPEIHFKYKSKLYSLVNKDTPCLFLVRDQISRLKTSINHQEFKPGFTWGQRIHLKHDDIAKCLDKMIIHSNHDDSYLKKRIHIFLNDSFCKYNTFVNFLNSKNIYYIDFKELLPDVCFNTLCNLSKKFNFKQPSEKYKNFIETIDNDCFSYIIPVILIFENLEIICSKKDMNLHDNNYKTINSELNIKHNYINKLDFYIDIKYIKLYFKIKNDPKLFKDLKNYVTCFLNELENRINKIENGKVDEKHLLEFFIRNKDIRNNFYKLVHNELIHIKQHRPDIVASWKYYQEFEKMCEELDGKNKIEQK